MKRPRVRTRTVLITGCSSGIGRTTAEHLREAGWRVLATARSDSDLDDLRKSGFEALHLDLTHEASVLRCADEALELCPDGLGGLVNNAGYAQAGAVEDLEGIKLRRQLEVNVVGLQVLTNRIMPTMRSQGWGRVVNISSVYGRVAAPFVGAYCASKFAVEALSDAMRIELWSTGVGVSLIEPGAIISEFRNNAASIAEESLDSPSRFNETYRRKIFRKKNRPQKPSFFVRQPIEVAHKIRHALESPRPRRRYGVTPAATLAAVLRRVAPDALLDAIQRRAGG